MEYETFERECVVAASGMSPIHPSKVVHSQSTTARHRAFCAQYGTHRWPPHEGAADALAQPAFCKLKVMAIAAESCPALRKAYENMYSQMLAGVEMEIEVPCNDNDDSCDGAREVEVKAEEAPPTFSLNVEIHDMGLSHLATKSLEALQRAVSATYTIASCASASYPPVHEVPNMCTQHAYPPGFAGLGSDKHYPMDFHKEAKHAIHLYCYKLIRGGTGTGTTTIKTTAAAAIIATAAPAVYTAPTASAAAHRQPMPTTSGGFGSDGYHNGGFGVESGGGGDDERVRFGDILEEILGVEDLDIEAQQELKMMAGMTMAQMDRKRKFTRPRDDMGGRIYTEADRDAMGAAITRCMKSKRAKMS
jgi:hypothetical protein